jgi:hypothetical protein
MGSLEGGLEGEAREAEEAAAERELEAILLRELTAAQAAAAFCDRRVRLAAWAEAVASMQSRLCCARPLSACLAH